MTAQVAVRPLADCAALLPELADWLHAAWHAEAGLARAQSEWVLSACLGTWALPVCLVGVRGMSAAAMVSLLPPAEGEGKAVAGCQLASLYVREDLRGQGIGSTLVAAAALRARALGLPAVTVFSARPTTLYTRLGWRAAGSAALPDGRALHRYVVRVAAAALLPDPQPRPGAASGAPQAA